MNSVRVDYLPLTGSSGTEEEFSAGEEVKEEEVAARSKLKELSLPIIFHQQKKMLDFGSDKEVKIPMAVDGRSQVSCFKSKSNKHLVFGCVGLLLITMIAVLCLWKVSTKNSMLTRELEEMTDKFILTSMHKIAAEKRAEALRQQMRVNVEAYMRISTETKLKEEDLKKQIAEKENILSTCHEEIEEVKLNLEICRENEKAFTSVLKYLVDTEKNKKEVPEQIRMFSTLAKTYKKLQDDSAAANIVISSVSTRGLHHPAPQGVPTGQPAPKSMHGGQHVLGSALAVLNSQPSGVQSAPQNMNAAQQITGGVSIGRQIPGDVSGGQPAPQSMHAGQQVPVGVVGGQVAPQSRHAGRQISVGVFGGQVAPQSRHDNQQSMHASRQIPVGVPGGQAAPPGLQPPGLQPPGLQPPGLQPPGLQPPARAPPRAQVGQGWPQHAQGH